MAPVSLCDPLRAGGLVGRRHWRLMEMVVKKDDLAIEIPRLDVQMMEITVIGETPLIVHAWSAKAKKQMLDSHMKKATKAKEAKDPKADFQTSMYRLDDGGYGFPSVGFRSAAATAALTVDKKGRAGALRAFQVLGDDIDVAGAFEGTVMRQSLVRIEGCEPRMREDLVRVGMGTADLRYRAEFPDWYARLLVRYQPRLLSAEQLLNLINLAGFSVGVGEWRPEKKGSNGMFRVASEQDIAKLEAASLPKAA